jgi:hypothetical protein
MFRPKLPDQEPATKIDLVLIDAAINDMRRDLTYRMVLIAAIAVLIMLAVRIFAG